MTRQELDAIARAAGKRAGMTPGEWMALADQLAGAGLLEPHGRKASSSTRLRRRRRRPSIDPGIREAWDAFFTLINRVRNSSVQTLKGLPALSLIAGMDIVPRSLRAFDEACFRLLAWWAQDPDRPAHEFARLPRAPEAPGPAAERAILSAVVGIANDADSPAARSRLWLLTLIGALEAFRSSRAGRTARYGVPPAPRPRSGF